jgi:urea transport system substrate-binding protein
MAISETTLKDVMLMLIESRTPRAACWAAARGGGGRSRLGLAALRRTARELITVHEVDVIFGCWTSVSRKSVLPVIEELNGLLFYPVQYEGEESLARTCSIPAPRRTSRRSRRPITS